MRRSFTIHVRAVLFSKLTPAIRAAIMRGIPRNAAYVRTCLKAWWKTSLELDLEKSLPTIKSESVWRNWRFQVRLPPHQRKYLENVLEIALLGDLVPAGKTRFFRRSEWEDFIDELHTNRHGQPPSNLLLRNMCDAIQTLVRNIPHRVRRAVITEHPLQHKVHDVVAVIRPDRPVFYAKYINRNRLIRLWVDATGSPHDTGVIVKPSPAWDVLPVTTWSFGGAKERDDGRDTSVKDVRIVGPRATSFPANSFWLLHDSPAPVQQMHIHVLTRAPQYARMLPPPAEESWPATLGLRLDYQLPWRKIWKLKSPFTTPRDRVPWLKLRHRNLHVPSRDRSLPDQRCVVCKLRPESMTGNTKGRGVWTGERDGAGSAAGVRIARLRTAERTPLTSERSRSPAVVPLRSEK